MKRNIGLLMCALALGCGDPQGNDFADNGVVDDRSVEPKVAPDPQTGIYAFDCDTIVGGIEDLPLEISVSPDDAFLLGQPTEATLSGSVTLDQDTTAGILDRLGNDPTVDVNQSSITVQVSGAAPGDVPLPGPTIPGFDLSADTDGDGLAGPHTFEVGPVVAEITPTGASTVDFTIDIDSLNLSLGGVPIIGSLTIPDFCRSRALDGEPLTFEVSGGDDGSGGTGGRGGSDGGTGGSGGSDDDGTGGAGGSDDSDDPCMRDRFLDDGRVLNGRLRERLCRLLRRHRR